MAVWVMVKNSFFCRLQEELPKAKILLDEPMSRHTSFRIGGPADIMLVPKCDKEISAAVLLAKSLDYSFTVIGNGSNILVRDKGIRGLVLKVSGGLTGIEITDSVVSCKAGELLGNLASKTALSGLAGLEFAAGIPGSVGGGIVMNAGAYDGEMKDFLQSVEVVSCDGEIISLSLEQLAMSYRTSVFANSDYIITGAVFMLPKGNVKESREKIADFNNRRLTKQPLELPSAGSTFKRPQGNFASCLIDEAGLKGLSVGGAQVSEKHAGFIVNKGDATANDVLQLVALVQDKVRLSAGVDLQLEIKVIGE